ncbi:Transcriptional accessory protein [Escherichia coli P12b]|nr:Transcriptional accessory protein [Escherichia coli P12b]
MADLLWSDPSHTPEVAAAQYVDADKGVADTKAALDGARYILMERFAEDAALLAKVRDYLWKNAHFGFYGGERYRRGRGEIPRLFRSSRTVVHGAFSPHAGDVPWA